MVKNKEQWDYIGKEYLPVEEPIIANRDVYAMWINPFTEERKLLLIKDNSTYRTNYNAHLRRN